MLGGEVERQVGWVTQVIGRDKELASLTDFITAVSTGPTAVIVQGEAGIGKTTLWQWTVAEAERRCYRIMVARPLEAETTLSFSALGDLLDDGLDDVLSRLPQPQRLALEVALLRKEPGQTPPDQRAVSVAFRSAIRLLAKERPVLIALDDLQWLDPSSSRVLAFALHRLHDEPVGVLAARREGKGVKDPFAMDRALREGALTRLQVAPLHDAQVIRLLRKRFGGELTYPLSQRVASTSGGNPFLAIQIAELLVASGSRPAPGEPLPIPDDAREVARARINALTRDAKETLGACALSARPTVDVVGTVIGARRARAGLQEAADAGVVELDGADVSFAHPLLTAAAYAAMAPRERRALHRRFAAAVDEPEQRGRHLALAADGPDPSVASALDAAARQARARGAPAAGAELLELACRLTHGKDKIAMHRRVLEAADYHFEAGDVARARSLLNGLLETAPRGPLRAEALLYLCDFLWCDVRQIRPLLKQALEEVGDEEDALRIEVLEDLAWVGILGGNLREGHRYALVALEIAERLGDAACLARALLGVGHAEFFMGKEASATMERAVSLQHSLEGRRLLSPPRRLWGGHLMWAGNLDLARRELERDHKETVEAGQLTNLWEVLAYLAELEVRAGNWEKAARYAVEGHDSALDTGLEQALDKSLSARARVEAHRGDVEGGRAHASEGLRLAEAHDYWLEIIRNRSVLGFLELSLGDAAAAHAYLEPLPEMANSMGLQEPGIFPFIPDAIEALTGIGELARTEPMVEWLEERGQTLGRSLAIATAARCRGQIAAVRGDLPAAQDALDLALEEHERAHQPFELARTLLISGEVHRRYKRKRVARDAFRAALEIFDRLGARLWSDRARDGLRRVGDKPEPSSGLTPTERRVADLVAEGRTNREVADALFLSVKTVEANLSRIYHKVGVRSRTELAHRMSGPSEGAPERP